MRHVFYIGQTGIGSDLNDLYSAINKGHNSILKNTAKAVEVQAHEQAKTKQVLNYVTNQANEVHHLLTSYLPLLAAEFATYQIYHETGAFHSTLWVQHNNGAGIKFAHQKGAVMGANGYAWFPGTNGRKNFVAALVHELKKKANPAGAATIQDYVHRLKINGFFKDTEDNYLHGMLRARLVLKGIPAEINANADNIPAIKKNLSDYLKELQSWAESHPMEAVAAGIGSLVIVTLLKR